MGEEWPKPEEENKGSNPLPAGAKEVVDSEMNKWKDEMTAAGVSPTEMAPFREKARDEVIQNLTENAPDLGTYIKFHSEQILSADDPEIKESKWWDELQKHPGWCAGYGGNWTYAAEEGHFSRKFIYASESGIKSFTLDSNKVAAYKDLNEELLQFKKNHLAPPDTKTDFDKARRDYYGPLGIINDKFDERVPAEMENLGFEFNLGNHFSLGPHPDNYYNLIKKALEKKKKRVEEENRHKPRSNKRQKFDF